MTKKYITDILNSHDIQKWKPGDNILISAPMGAGKSYFCKNVLYAIARTKKCKILMLIHRVNCVDQFKYELEADGKSDVIDVTTYQSLEYSRLHGADRITLSDYAYIVCDEFHYFFNDSSFNNKTAVSFNMIMEDTDAVHIFMSATGESMTRYMKMYIEKKKLPAAIEYELPFDFSFMRELTFFHKDITMEEFIKEGIQKGDKGIFFIQSAEKAYKLYSKYKKYCLFNCSANNTKYYEHVDKEKIRDMLVNQRFEEQFLITTSCFDAGINIIDLEVNHIVIDIVDVGSLIQCIGRKRIQSDDDTVSVYIKIINNQKLAGLKRSMEQKVEMADYYREHDYDVTKLIEKYPMQNDMNNMIYDDLMLDEYGNVISGSYTKKINEPMYFKKKEDIAEYQYMIKEYGEFGYCKYLARFFGFYDACDNKYTYRLINEDYELTSFLKNMVKEETVLLQLRDRGELIKKINARQDGKILKSQKTLNGVLEEREIDYRIREFSTTRYSTDAAGKKKKKIYKNAWKIIQVEPKLEVG